jgi:hypothetical protein
VIAPASGNIIRRLTEHSRVRRQEQLPRPDIANRAKSGDCFVEERITP